MLLSKVFVCVFWSTFSYRLWSRGRINVDVLRLLVNLCCCPDLVPYVLAARVSKSLNSCSRKNVILFETVPGLLTLFDISSQPIDVLLRSVTMLLCICTAIDTLGIEYYSHIAPLNVDPFGSELQTVYFSLFGAIAIDDLLRRLVLLRRHDNDEISSKSARIIKLIDEHTRMMIMRQHEQQQNANDVLDIVIDDKCTAPSLKRLWDDWHCMLSYLNHYSFRCSYAFAISDIDISIY